MEAKNAKSGEHFYSPAAILCNPKLGMIYR